MIYPEISSLLRDAWLHMFAGDLMHPAWKVEMKLGDLLYSTMVNDGYCLSKIEQIFEGTIWQSNINWGKTIIFEGKTH